MADNLFLEVFCEVTGKDYLFTTGTKAKSAVSVINRKLGGSLKSHRVLYIVAAKEGEEPISFGDNASLLNYGHGWKLKTVMTDADFPVTNDAKHGMSNQNSYRKHDRLDNVYARRPRQEAGSEHSNSKIDLKPEEFGEQSLRYMGRIFVAFVLMFVLGGLFTMPLENLPRLLLLFNNSSI